MKIRYWALFVGVLLLCAGLVAGAHGGERPLTASPHEGAAAEAEAKPRRTPFAPGRGARQALAVDVQEVNPGTTFARGLCLAVGLGAGAASECGDLRLAHGLPAVRTLNQARAPVLIYNSQHAAPHPVVSANVTLPRDGLSRVVATLRVNGVPRGQGVWRGATWPQTSGPVRVAVGYDASADRTGPYRYTLEVRAHYATTSLDSTVRGQLVVVNRRESPLGAGWWLAGLEQLVMDPFGRPALWVGGDGSTRRYVMSSADTMKWAVVPALDRPDTLLRSGSGWIRLVRGGARVEFDAQGRHVATHNRLGQVTRFVYDVQGRLERIEIPPAGSGLSYTFVYGGDDRLGRVDAPGVQGAGGAPRSVVLARSGSQLSITDPDTTHVVFTHADATRRRIVSRTDRRGHTTLFRYDAIGRVAASRLDLENGDSIVRRLHAAESRGLAEGVHADSAYTLLDGPREDTDVLDHTRLWLDRWGAPLRIKNALGHETVLTRGNSTFPALVTEVRAPNGLVTRATYDARGNVEATTVLNPYGDGRHATTRYEWHPKWDMVTKLVNPEQDSVLIGYDPDTGSRLWQQVGPDSARRVRFAYYAGTGLLATATAPGASRPDSVSYDPLGNLRQTITPKGFRALYLKDQLGRDTLIVSPIDTVSARDSTQLREKGARQRITYDGMDRVLRTQGVGPAQSYVPKPLNETAELIPAEVVWVENAYDPEGNVEKVSRWVDPDINAIGTLTTAWRYDRAGRRVAEIAPGSGPRTETISETVCEDPVDPSTCTAVMRDTTYMVEYRDSTRYDPAGNAVESITRRGHSISMQYDALGRLTKRIVPEVGYGQSSVSFTDGTVWYYPLYRQDSAGGFSVRNDGTYGLTIPANTADFTYDEAGNLLTADNRDARISRSYNLNGTVRSDTLRIRTYTGADFGRHGYGLRFGYDLNGRRTWMKHPEGIAPRPGGVVKDSISYSYHPITGQLDSVRDVLGNRFEYLYDLEGQVERFLQPGGIEEGFVYDADGRIERRQETASRFIGQPNGFSEPTIHADTFRYDARNKILRVWSKPDSAVHAYSGLGTLAWSFRQDRAYQGIHQAEERYTADALGNHRRMKRVANQGTEIETRPDSSDYRYQPGTARLVQTIGLRQVIGGVAYEPSRLDTLLYDLSGNKDQTLGSIRRASNEVLWEGSRYYYAADEKLHLVDKRTCVFMDDGSGTMKCNRSWEPGYNDRGAFEEHRYDALGRRILVRTRSEEMCRNNCDQSIRRFVWDGDQILYEMRYPGHTGVGTDTLEQDTGYVAGNGFAPYGRVAYAHGQKIDRPLSITRMNYSLLWPDPTAVIPHENWRNLFDTGSFEDGSARRCKDYSAGADSTCIRIDWPAPHLWMPLRDMRLNKLGPISWMGSLSNLQRDASGQLYRRNRYYNPETSRFTQEDPIGLAGGLNLYGFANGDPVSYSDPYGLCPEKGSSIDCPIVLPEVTVNVWRITPSIDPNSILIGGGVAGRAAAPTRALLVRLGSGLRHLLGRRTLSNPDRALLRDFFGQGMKGARDRAADFRIPEGLGREALTKYRQVATEAIENGMDKSGVQAERIKLIDRALETLP